MAERNFRRFLFHELFAEVHAEKKKQKAVC